MTKIDVTHPNDLQVGDTVVFRLTHTSETKVEGSVESTGTRGAVKVKDYGWVDFSDAEWNAQTCVFISAVREVKETPHWKPGTLGRAFVTIRDTGVRMYGVVDRSGNFHWAGQIGEGIAPMGSYRNFEPITFGELSNAHIRAASLEQKLNAAREDYAELRRLYLENSDMSVTINQRLNEPTHVKIVRKGQLIVDGFVSGDLRKAVVHDQGPI